MNLKDKFPIGIQLLLEKLYNDSENYIYGECIYDRLYYNTIPKHINISTSLSKNEILDRLNIEMPEDYNCFENEMTLYYSDSVFHLLEGDFLAENLKENYYIEIKYDDKDFLKYIASLDFPIDKAYVSDRGSEHIDCLEIIYNNKKIELNAESEAKLCKNLYFLYRYYRYKAKYHLENTKDLRPTVEKQPLKAYSRPYNWKKEFIKLMELDKPSRAFEEMRKNTVLEHVFDELLEGYQVSQNEYHEYDVYYHSLNACDSASPDNLLIRIAALFHDIGKPRSKKEVQKGENLDPRNVFYDHENIGARMTYQILKKYGFTHSSVLQLSKLVRLHMFHYTSEWTDTAVRRLIRKAEDDLENLFKLRAADRLGSGKKIAESKAIKRLETRINQIIEYDNRTTVKDLDINGDEVMTLFSLKPGPMIGKLLNYLLGKMLEDESINSKEKLIEMSKEWLDENVYVERGQNDR